MPAGATGETKVEVSGWRFPYHRVYFHCPGQQREGRRRRGPLFPFVLVLLVNGLTLALLGWGVYARSGKTGGNPLQGGLPSPKFKVTSAKRPAEPEMPALAKEPEKSAPGLEEPSSPSIQEAVAAVAPLRTGAAVVPVDSAGSQMEKILVFSSTHSPGDSPMTRTWKMMDLAALLTLALASGPALAQTTAADKEATDTKAILKRLEDMDKSLAKAFKDMGKDVSEIKKDITDLKGDHLTQRIELDRMATKITQLEGQVSKLQAEMDKMKKRLPVEGASLYPPIDKAGLDEIKTKLGQIEQAVAKIQQVPSRVSLSPAASGRIMLVNLYWEELLFLVNGRTFRVAPHSTMPLEGQQAGTFSYEVISPTWGLRAQNTRVLGPNETFTITAQ